jgi:hypothetical protein
MTSPTPPGDPAAPAPASLAYPTRTKMIVVAVLAVAIGFIVLAGLSTTDGDDPGLAVSGQGAESADGPAAPPTNGVERVIPRDGAEILGQERIGIDLAPGWTGELMLVREGGEALTLPEDEVVRDELNRILYQPGPGRAVERLSGDYCVAATIWDQVRGREASQRVETWCFSAT